MSQGVDRLDGVLSRIFWHKMSHVQSHIAKIEGNVETRCVWQRLSIVVELNAQVGIVNWLHLALKVSGLALNELGCSLKLKLNFKKCSKFVS